MRVKPNKREEGSACARVETQKAWNFDFLWDFEKVEIPKNACTAGRNSISLTFERRERIGPGAKLDFFCDILLLFFMKKKNC